MPKSNPDSDFDTHGGNAISLDDAQEIYLDFMETHFGSHWSLGDFGDLFEGFIQQHGYIIKENDETV